MIKILTVDDAPLLRSLLRYALEDGGYTDITEAVDGVDALKKAQKRSFDLVITDINMPNMNGFQLIKKLREMSMYAKTPLLVLTTESSDEMKAKGQAVGATGWIVKPFQADKVLAAIGIIFPKE